MNNQKIVTVDIDRQNLELLKDAFSNTSYAKIALNIPKSYLKITCPLKKKVAARRNIIQLDKECINGITIDEMDGHDEVIMRLAYPSDAVSCIRIPEGEDKITIAFIIANNIFDEGVNASIMEIRDISAGTFKFKALSSNAARIWNEVKDGVMNQRVLYSFDMTPSAMWSINTLNKMSRSIDTFLLIAQPEKPIEIRVYNGLDDGDKEKLSSAVASKIISSIDKLDTINTILIDSNSNTQSKDSTTVISIISPEVMAILPFNKHAGTFHISGDLVYYDIDNERYVLPIKKQV